MPLVVFTVRPARKESKLLVDFLLLYPYPGFKEGNQITAAIMRPTAQRLTSSLELRLPVGA